MSRFKRVELTTQEKYDLDVATIAFMNECPFYAHVMYSIGDLVPTRDVPTAATDGRHIAINPDYVLKLKVSERVFVLAHEMSHLVARHPSRFRHYNKADTLRGKPWVHMWANICADYVINADLKESKIGTPSPDWLYDPTVKGSDLWEDVYERTFPKLPPPPPGGGGGKPKQGQGGQPSQGGNAPQPPPPGLPTPSTFKSSGQSMKGQKGDPTAAAQGGGFDEVLEPYDDPATGDEDLPDEAEFREAIARAYGAAKAMGKVPGGVQRLVDELLAPKVDWREHIRLLVAGKIGVNAETWARPNRRRLALNPLVIMPGKRGYGCERVVVAVDTSGSIGEDEFNAFFAEIGGILQDCRPKEIIVIGCDAAVSQVDSVKSLDEFTGLRQKGIKGGGGTRFEPVFDYVREENLRPETLVYLTDMCGTFPREAPGYPVVWCATTDATPPWGEVVRLELERD